jgi:uncharacterized protein (DUF2336 family)
MSHAALRERQGSVAERAALAARAETAPELLTWLAADPAAEVRIAVAANPATPPQAGLLLAEDADIAVREALARRVGRQAPRIAAAAPDRLTRITGTILGRLVEDAAVAVRAALSDAVAGLPDAPRDLILRLARDAELAVAEPVLRLSPLLADDDLLALVAAPPAGFTRRVVAARPRLAEPVTEAIAGTTDAPAVAALLANPSAAIREATLDRLAAGASDQLAWQAALVRRPRLPANAARALGAILAAHLLDLLASRPDLPEGLAETLRPRIEARLAAAAASQDAALDAAHRGDRPALASALTEATGYDAARIEAALALRSPRAITALCWRAGWSADCAEEVQLALGVPRGKAVRPNVEGGWTLSMAELQWQIELLEELPA